MTLRLLKIESLILYSILLSTILPLSIFIYAVPSLSSLFLILKYSFLLLPLIYLLKGFYVELRMLLVITIFLTTILINDISKIYTPEFRLISWILLILSVGPFIVNEHLQRFREKLLNLTLFIFMSSGFLSFLYYILGLPKLGIGHFTGVFIHSMLLAPIASIGAIYALVKSYQTFNLKSKLIYILFFITNLLCVILAASRTALAGLVFVVFIFILFTNIKYKKILLTFIIIFGFFSTQFINININNFDLTNSISNRGIDNTREELWHDRILEFNSSPFFGVGFSAQDNSLKGKLSFNISNDGKVEPGSTYLMILSMTGLLGASALIILFSKYYLYINKLRNATSNYFLLIFIFFLIHFIAEGYIYSSGSLMAYTFWLLIGATYPNSYKGNH